MLFVFHASYYTRNARTGSTLHCAMPIPSLARINAARARIMPQLHVTPVLRSRILGEVARAGSLSLKCEVLQKTGSFKVRGALNAISEYEATARERGVVTVSAGNHAQAVAWAASAAGVRSTVVMPETASRAKIDASRGYGAEVILHGTGAQAFAKARELADTKGFLFIHPFDDPAVIAGAASCGMEIVEQVPEMEVLVVPIGGGGLIAGVASAVKQTRPGVRIFGVEPTGADSMYQSLKLGRAVTLEGGPATIADGLASPYAGEVCFEIVRQLVDEVVLVSDEEIAAAMPLMLTRTKILAEPAGAASIAALLNGRIPAAVGGKVVAIVSGGNVDLEKLKELI
jgi:threonine dehydratase